MFVPSGEAALELVTPSLREVQRAHRLEERRPGSRSGLPYLELLVQRHEARKRQALSPSRLAEAEAQERRSPRAAQEGGRDDV